MYGRSRGCWSGCLGRVTGKAEANVDWFESGHYGVGWIETVKRVLVLYESLCI